jgi:hypothetical protein
MGPMTEGKSTLTIFPNPVGTTAILKGKLSEKAAVKLYILDAAGKKVMSILDRGSEAEGAFSVTCNFSKLSKGLYFAIMETKNGRVITKFVKE